MKVQSLIILLAVNIMILPESLRLGSKYVRLTLFLFNLWIENHDENCTIL